MSGASDRFMDAALALGLRPDVRHFPQGTKTANDAAQAIGCDVAQIVKSLVFVADGRPVLVLTSGRNRVDTRALADACAATSVRRATPEEARAATGFAVGGTPPFGHPERLRAVVDPDLLAFEEVWAAAGTPDTVFPISPSDLVAHSHARPAPVAEVAPVDEG